ncbi:uncharacterized protein Z519_05774 [Cladophialophora bantiana CBS 173.52]|uniref:F-box domain-containing protein n=1 Tax=Cladophialophora bantiana (strain ATCC 10958 / CBS 173.52 / CDC B-1940 / NIH 8579) TaxID=1442370 RepID=A0A0D2I8P1_CLAB1|nr:uncharacterized protein Z519_05774 [Cladophialophora bantiana CBS 173.52]KIW93169.1 hypothetical protein Z519_05774 [Cladophialophora bantiana CBS 173.52]
MASSSGDGPGVAATNLPETSTTCAPATLSFFDIPAEVRVEIYELLYCFPRTVHLAFEDDRKGKFKHWRDYPVTRLFNCEPALPVHALVVAKKFYQEASLVLYQRNKFRIEWEDLNDALTQWNQKFNICLSAIDLLCECGPAWGFVPAIRALIDKMPGLREINIKIHGSCRLSAAALETSNAIVPCASMFGGPDLELIAIPLNHNYCDEIGGGRDVEAIINTIRQENSKLADIWPQTLPTKSITRFNAPNLSLVRLCGHIDPRLLAKIEQHKCLPGDCRWMKVGQEAKTVDTGSETWKKDNLGDLARNCLHYKWRAMDPRERTDIPVINMRQWHPPLTEKEKRKVRDFARLFARRDKSCQDNESPSGEYETAIAKDEGASEADPPSKGDDRGTPRLPAAKEENYTSSTCTSGDSIRAGWDRFADGDEEESAFGGCEPSDQGGTSQEAPPINAENEEIEPAEEIERASTEPASPEELLDGLQELPFADWFEDVADIFMHKDSADAIATLQLEFGPFFDYC